MPVVPNVSLTAGPAPRPGPLAGGRPRQLLGLSGLMLLAGALAASATTGSGRNPAGPAVPGAEPADYAIAIPGRAMLQAADLGGATTTTVDYDHWACLLPPEPCTEDAYPSAALCRGSRAVSAVLDDGLIVEHVAVYQSNGARRYVRDLRRALDDCRGIDPQGSWKILDSRPAGRDSLLLRLRHKVELAGQTSTMTTFIAVARIGRVLVVVADIGGEAGDGSRGRVEELITPALRRASILL